MSEVPVLDLEGYERDVVEHALFGAARARLVEDLVDGQPWSVDLERGEGEFGGVRRTVQILGTHSAGDDTFLWAWANPGATGWGPSLVAAKEARALGDKPGYSVFRERKVSGEWVPFRELAWVTGELLGGRPVHLAAAGNATTVALILGDADVDPSSIPPTHLPGLILDFQPETFAPRVPCVTRFLQRIGFVVEDDGSAVSARRSDAGLTIPYDEEGRISEVKGIPLAGEFGGVRLTAVFERPKT